ncbi:MAG: hypothetical protein VZQ55_03085 [Ruminococcus sp.]|nr:hypothetical protein [Ruminococcus sp.]
MAYIRVEELYDYILMYIDEDIVKKYGEKGLRKNILNYVKNIVPNKIINKNGKIYVSDGLQNKDFVFQYLKKEDSDYSAKDIAERALKPMAVPPKMSANSLEKRIRDLFIEYKDNVYFKRVKTKTTACVDYETSSKIIISSSFTELFHKQIDKSERKQNASPEWKAYKEEKDWVESQRSYDDDYNDFIYLSSDNELFIMVKAIFSKLFTGFDTDKYNRLYNEWRELENNHDFGERYQELKNIFNSTNFNNEFFRFEPNDYLLNVLADKISEKIIKKLEEKGS